MPRWIKSILFDWFFEASCNKHDVGYILGGNEMRRLYCDWRFLQAMTRDVKRLNPVLMPFAMLEALVFFLLVRLFGWMSFNYG